jgi:hypothetical protein
VCIGGGFSLCLKPNSTIPMVGSRVIENVETKNFNVNSNRIKTKKKL